MRTYVDEETYMRAVEKGDSDLINELMEKHWGGEPLIVNGRNFYPSKLNGILLFKKQEILGFLFYDVQGTEYEIIVFEVFEKFKGLGTALLNEFINTAKENGCTRVHLMTTNDNVDALRFYQRRGFTIEGIRLNALQESRQKKPSIPAAGDYGIPLRDEIELECRFHKEEKRTKEPVPLVHFYQRFEGRFRQHPRTRELFFRQLEILREAAKSYKLPAHGYKAGDEVLLKKGTFLHGTRKGLDGLPLIKEHGFLSSEMYKEENRESKTPWCVSMWNIQNDIKLKDYINNYSGATIEYIYPGEKNKTKLIPYNKLQEELESMRRDEFWMWRAEQTKEIRFLPSLAKDINQVGFIINTHNEYAKKLIKNDIFGLSFDKDILKTFIGEWFIKDYIYAERNDFTTNRESVIVVGMPACLAEGILVGRDVAQDGSALAIIREQFPDCYICNLDGVVI